jgi:hypothetical protein
MSHEGHDHGSHRHDHAGGPAASHGHTASIDDVASAKPGKDTRSGKKDETTIIVEEVKNGKRIVKSQNEDQVQVQKGQKKAVKAKADSGTDVDMVEDSPSPPKRAKRGTKA